MAEPGQTRKLAAIVSADVVGYARLMQGDDEATVATLKEYRAAVARIVARHGGRVVNAPGDSILCELAAAAEAVQAAIDIQGDIAARNTELAEERRMHFRIGVHLGDVIEEEDGSIYGDTVNIAARLEGLAPAGGICISGTVHDAIAAKLDLGFDFLGKHEVKNIAQPVRVYRVRGEAPPAQRRRLRPALAGGAAALVLAVAAGAWLARDEPPPRTGPSIAVLPFTNMSGDPEQDYFADGISEDIITELSRFEGLLVIARTSSFRFKGQNVDVAEVAKALGVRYVLEGGVRREGDRVRITAQLIDAETGGHLWAERYDRELTDVFAVQDDVTRQIIAALRSELGEAAVTRPDRPLTENIEAYDLYLRARTYANRRTMETNQRAQEMFLRAVELDPAFAAAYAELSFARFLAWLYGWKPADSLDAAIEAAERAVALDQHLPLAQARLAWVRAWQGRLDEALVLADRAVALDGNFAEGHVELAIVHLFAGDLDAALVAVERAMRLDPYSARAVLVRGNIRFAAEDYEHAIVDLKAALGLSPDFGAGHQFLAAIYGLLGRDAEARAEAAEVLRLSPDFGGGGILRLPFRDQAVLARIADGLRKAGLEVPDPPPQ